MHRNGPELVVPGGLRLAAGLATRVPELVTEEGPRLEPRACWNKMTPVRFGPAVVVQWVGCSAGRLPPECQQKAKSCSAATSRQ